MTSSKFATDGGANGSELPELQRPEHGQNGVEEEDDEGFQTVVSKRTVKLLQQQQQQQYQNRHNNRRGYHNGNNGYGGHHSYGNGNGRHYHRQYGPPHSSSSGANSNSSTSSIPEELPKDHHHSRQDENQTADSPTPPRPQPITIIPPNKTSSSPVMAWARIAAGEKPPKLDVPQSPGSTESCHSPVSSTFDMKPLAISLVTSSACEGTGEESPIVKTSCGKRNSVPQTHDAAQEELDGQSQSPTTTPTSQRPQVILPPPPPSVSVWKLRAAAHSGGQTKSDVAQSSGNAANSVVAGTTRGKLPPIIDWPSLDDAVKPLVKAEIKLVSFTSQTGGTTPSESATDSGNEEILRITGPPELSDEKWPLPLVSNGIGGKGPHGTDGSLGLIEKLRQSRHSSGDAMSSSGCDFGGNGEGQDDEGPESTDTKKKRKNKKASKPKWVPLILEDEPPKPPSKPKKRIRDKFSIDRGNQQQHNGDSHGGGATGGEGSSECATPTDGLPRGKSSGPGRGGRNGHKGKHGHRNYHGYKFYKETSDPSQTQAPAEGNGDLYSDYPPEFTTLNPMYPMTEFVMPYTNYATYSPPPDAQSYSYVPIPIDDAVLTQLIQKQIEYYFSEENLERDFYLRRKMDSEGYIPISLISSFYRIQSLTQDDSVVLNAIKSSELIEVKEDEESGCASARPVDTPTKWPIVDTAAASIPPPPTIGKSFLLTSLVAPPPPPPSPPAVLPNANDPLA